jgi:hypothetical protein
LKGDLDAGGYGVQGVEEASHICQHSTKLHSPPPPQTPYSHCKIYYTSLQLKMANAMNAEMLDQLQHVTELNPKSQNYSKTCRL